MAEGVIRLVDGRGRKYLTAGERERFLAAAAREARPERHTFALVLAHSGARLSEVLPRSWRCARGTSTWTRPRSGSAR